MKTSIENNQMESILSYISIAKTTLTAVGTTLLGASEDFRLVQQSSVKILSAVIGDNSSPMRVMMKNLRTKLHFLQNYLSQLRY